MYIGFYRAVEAVKRLTSKSKPILVQIAFRVLLPVPSSILLDELDSGTALIAFLLKQRIFRSIMTPVRSIQAKKTKTLNDQ